MHKYSLLLGTVAASIATLVGVVLIHDPAPAPSDPFAGLHMSAPEEGEALDIADDDVRLAPTVSYQSDTLGYKLSFPATWSLDDSRESFDGDILADPLEHAVVTISSTDDVTCVTPNDIKRLAYSIRQSLEHDPSFTLESFERLYWQKQPAIFSEGIRRIGGRVYHTREYNIVRPGHIGIFNVSITTQEDSETLYEQALQHILHSLEVHPKK